MRARDGVVPALLAAVVVIGVLGCGGQRRPSVSITIAGKREQVPVGTTLAQAAARFRVEPAAGSLLDVSGRLLHRDIFPGALLVDGRRVPGTTKLNDGERVDTVAGRSQTEPLRRQLVPVRGGALSDPEFTLSRTPGVNVVVRGTVSGELVSVRFQPSGRQSAVERAVALTFDDGPWPQNTARILAVLRRFHVHATFFLIGYLAASYPKLVALERRSRMTIGNHSYNHPQVPPFGDLPQQLMKDEITLAAQDIARAGVQPQLFRPPGGSYSPALLRTAQALGERVVLWSVDPSDWSPGVTSRQIVSRVLASVRPGSIVILHDGGGDRSATIRALPAIITGIRQRGLRLVELKSAPAAATAH
jgi:peptidoglycan/xylan/chitin deacetylase (PgdA/CDA1 family)